VIPRSRRDLFSFGGIDNADIRQTSRVPRMRSCMQRKRRGWRRGAPVVEQCRGERGSGTVVGVCLVPGFDTEPTVSGGRKGRNGGRG